MRLSGSLAVLAEVLARFIPSILAQNELRRAASLLVLGFGAGGVRLEPVVRLKCARPAALRPPAGFWYFFTTPMYAVSRQYAMTASGNIYIDITSNTYIKESHD